MNKYTRGMIDLQQQAICSSCDEEKDLYKHLINQEVYIDCDKCGFEEYTSGPIGYKKNICSYCEEPVYYSEEDPDFAAEGEENDKAIKCNNCDSYNHIECIAEVYHDKCNFFDSEDFDFQCNDCGVSSTYYECNTCGLYHESDCIVSFSDGFVGALGTICESCFYDDSKEIEETLDYIGLHEKLDKEEKRIYFESARENPDLSISCTHLVKGNTQEIAFSNLLNILGERCLKASITGFYHKHFQTSSVCLTELTTKGLFQHSKKYSPFGLSFLKGWIIEKGGGPAFYIPEALLKSFQGNDLPDVLKPFVNKINLEKYDFHHEREWRVPHDLNFTIDDILVVYSPVKFHGELKKKYPQIKILLDLHLLTLLG